MNWCEKCLNCNYTIKIWKVSKRELPISNLKIEIIFHIKNIYEYNILGHNLAINISYHQRFQYLSMAWWSIAITFHYLLQNFPFKEFNVTSFKWTQKVLNSKMILVHANWIIFRIVLHLQKTKTNKYTFTHILIFSWKLYCTSIPIYIYWKSWMPHKISIW